MTIINIINNFKSQKQIAKNTLYLSIMEGVELIIPFMALPYIINTVGADNYGKIAFAQSLVAYFAVIVNFGLSIVAAKEVAIYRDNKYELGKILCSMLIIKLFLSLVCMLFLNILVCFWSRTNSDVLLYNYCFGVCFADVFFTRWLYQGLEKMFMITLIRSSSLIIYIVLIFSFVNNINDYRKIPLMQSGCLIATSLIGLIFTFKHEKINPLFPDFPYIISFFKKSVPFFFSRCSLTINSQIATTVIGATLGDYEVAIYDIAQKIAKVALIPASMIMQAVYPHNVRNKDAQFATTIFLYMLVLVSFMLVCLYFVAPFGVNILSHGNLPESATLVRMFIPYIFVGSVSLYLGTSMLVAWGYSKPFNRSVYLSTAILAIVYCCFYFLRAGSPKHYCIVLFLGELGLASYRFYHCIKHKILKLHNWSRHKP